MIFSKAPTKPVPFLGSFAAPGVEPKDFYPYGMEGEFIWERAPLWLRGVTVKHENDGKTHLKLSSGTRITDHGKRLTIETRPPSLEDAAALVRLSAARFGDGKFAVHGPQDFVLKAWAAAEHAGVRFALTSEQKALYKTYKTEHRAALLAQCVETLGPATPKPTEAPQKPQQPSGREKPAPARRTARQEGGPDQHREPQSAAQKPTVDPETAALMEQVRAAQAQLQQQQALLAQRQQVAASVRVWRQTNPTPAADMPTPVPVAPGERQPFRVRAPR